MKIAFLENHLNIRGTSIALYDYAHYNETILGNKSFIITRPYDMFVDRIDVDKRVYTKFEERFPVFYYYNHADIMNILKQENPNLIYVIKAGDPGDGLHNFYPYKTFVHAVFQPRCPHGDLYAGISEWLNIQYRTNIPILPHMVSLPECNENLRETLHIPNDAIVFGRYGGYDTFDIIEAQRAVDTVSKTNPNIYFLFMHTKPFCEERKNIIHLSKCIDSIEKTKFINTCDAMIYGRSDGETFGLAIGEFSIKNKPIFATYTHPKMESLMHKHILQDKAFWYTTTESLVNQLLSFTPSLRDKLKQEDWNMYKQYSPENVIKIFNKMVEKLTKK